MSEIDDVFFLDGLIKANGYRDARPISGGRYACIAPLAFTHAIIVGEMHNGEVYDDRWCYRSYEAAKAALDAWDGSGEPSGWHRHPLSGRRRPDGDPEREFVHL
jgi:hypothetical protein